MEPFEYTFKMKIEKEDYVYFESLRKKWTKKVIIKRLVMLFAGCLLLLNVYTAFFGVALISIVILTSTATIWSRPVLVKNYKDKKYLKDELTFLITSESIGVSSKSLNVKTSWNKLGVWEIRENWLILKTASFPHVYLPVKELHENNLFDRIMKLCNKHGVEFGNIDDIKKKEKLING